MYVEYYEFFYKPTTITHQQITLLDEYCQLQCTYSQRPAVHWHRLDPDTEYIYCWNSSLEMVLGELSHSFAYHQWWVFILGGCIQSEERTKSHDDLNLEWYMIWQRIIVFDENNYKIIFPLSSIISLTDIIESKNFSFGRIRGNNVRPSQTTSCWMIFGPSKLSSEFGVSISYIQGLLKKEWYFKPIKLVILTFVQCFLTFQRTFGTHIQWFPVPERQYLITVIFNSFRYS